MISFHARRTGLPGPAQIFAALSAITVPCRAFAQHAPTLNIAGSFFPSWLFCAAVGAVACAMLRAAFGALNIAQIVVAPILTYSAIGLAVTLTVWLLWFGA